MPTLTIDGRTVTVRDGAYVLEAARKAGVAIPTLCDHPALEPWGGCRLCLVDVTRPEWDGSQKLVAACLYPAEDGLVVGTATPRVTTTRQVVLDLLLARCPDTALVRELAAAHGIAASSYPRSPEPTDCILCGLCTRVCDAIGVSAIASVDRGIGREVAPPFRQPPPDCIGCLACAEVCPTRCIPFETSDRGRTIWGREFEMLRCRTCGRAHVTVAAAGFWGGRNGVPAAWMESCDACKRKQVAATAIELGR
jgi:NADH dehydrogenase/NADH:ubiquinone oxidoreductase subunit G